MPLHGSVQAADTIKLGVAGAHGHAAELHLAELLDLDRALRMGESKQFRQHHKRVEAINRFEPEMELLRAALTTDPTASDSWGR